MSGENKEFDTEKITHEEMVDLVKEINKDSDWSGNWWAFTLLILLLGFGGWGSHDTKDHELRERVAKLEGQMDIISRRDK